MKTKFKIIGVVAAVALVVTAAYAATSAGSSIRIASMRRMIPTVWATIL